MLAKPISDAERTVLRSFARRIDPSDPGAHNNLGVVYYRKGLIEDAIAAFQHALELDPKMQIAQRNLEIAYRRSGYYDRRVAELRDRLRQHAADREARWELARTYASLGQHDDAAREFEQLLEHVPDDVPALTQLALVEKHRGRMERATELLERARTLEPGSGVIHQYLGEVLYNRGINQDALDALERSVALTPDNADAHYQMAFALGDMGRHEEARAATKRAIRLNPSLARAQTNLSLERVSRGMATPELHDAGLRATVPPVSDDAGTLAHYNLGLAFRQKGYYAEALREYRLALDRGEDPELVRQAVAEVHLLRRDHVAALDLYEQLVRELPDRPKLWNERGVVLHQLGRFDEAIASYEEARARDAGYGLALNNLGITLAQIGREEEAVDLLRDAMNAESELSIPAINLGLLLLRVGKFQLSIQIFRQVVERDATLGAAWNGIGLVLTEIGRNTDARNAFVRAVEADPRSAEAHYNLSFALSRLGDYDGALKAVTRAQTLDPYYVTQGFRLAIDLQYEDPTISVVPEISADVTTEVVGQNLQFDAGVLDNLFRELARPGIGDAPRSPSDAFALARDYLNKGFLELASAEANRAMGRGGAPAEGHLLLANIFARRGLHGEALERYRAARGAEPDLKEARLGEVRSLLALGRQREAAGEAEALVTVYGDDVDVLVALAESRLASNDPAAALEALVGARGRAPQRADLLKLEGDIAMGMGDFETAESAYGAALELDPGLVQVRVALGAVFERRERHADAEHQYRAALDALPTHTQAAVALANLYRRMGRARAAVNLLVDILAVDPSEIDGLLGLGHALLDDGRLEAAGEAFARVLARDEAHVGALFFSGVVLARRKEYRAAVQQWERVIAHDPGGPFAHRARQHARTALDLERIFQTEAA
jgi:tetratricopeptide (TPR) repeat protein